MSNYNLMINGLTATVEFSYPRNKYFEFLESKFEDDKFERRKTKSYTGNGFLSKSHKKSMIKEFNAEIVKNEFQTFLFENSKEFNVSNIISVNISENIEENFHFTVKLEIYPICVVKKYRNLEINYSRKNYTAQDIENKVDEFFANKKKYVRVNRAAEFGDLVIISYQGYNELNRIESVKGKNISVELGSNTFTPEVERMIVGIRPGERREFKVPLHVAESKNQFNTSGFSSIVCDVHKVFKVDQPLRDDKLAKSLRIKDVNTLSHIYRYAESKLRQELEEINSIEMFTQTIEKLLENTTVPLPDANFKHFAKIKINARFAQLKGKGLSEKQKYYSESVEDEYLELFVEQEKEAYKINAIISSIAQREKIVVTKSELDEEYKKISAEIEAQLKNLDKEKRESALENIVNNLQLKLKTKKVMNFLFAINQYFPVGI